MDAVDASLDAPARARAPADDGNRGMELHLFRWPVRF